MVTGLLNVRKQIALYVPKAEYAHFKIAMKRLTGAVQMGPSVHRAIYELATGDKTVVTCSGHNSRKNRMYLQLKAAAESDDPVEFFDRRTVMNGRSVEKKCESQSSQYC